MNAEDKLEGMLLKCSSGEMGSGGQVGLVSSGGLVVMTLGERSLANHPLLAEDDDDDEEDNEDLTRSSLVTHDLVPPEQLMMQEEMMKNGEEAAGGEVGFCFLLKQPNKFPCSLHVLVGSPWSKSCLDMSFIETDKMLFYIYTRYIKY